VSGALVDRYDGALFDLDGVVYLGPVAVPRAAEGIAALRQRGVHVGFVTNNAARSPRVVAAHLVELGIPAAAEDVVTSGQAAAHLLQDRFGRGARVLVVGGEGVLDAVAECGLVAVRSADDEPVAVIQGFGFELRWQELNEAAIAINRGAHWVATNDDPTRPTDRGLVPGNGAAVAAVQLAVTAVPEVAGKPHRPLLDDTVRRLGIERPIFVGDRLDTDVTGARNAGLDSLLVLTGSHGPPELLAADVGSRPTHLGQDLTALLAPPRVVELALGHCRAGSATAELVQGRLQVSGPSVDPVDALWKRSRRAEHSAVPTDEHRPHRRRRVDDPTALHEVDLPGRGETPGRTARGLALLGPVVAGDRARQVGVEHPPGRGPQQLAQHVLDPAVLGGDPARPAGGAAVAHLVPAALPLPAPADGPPAGTAGLRLGCHADQSAAPPAEGRLPGKSSEPADTLCA
jgi:glycerol 3-phosphatase-2